jgi:hypothetical protein
LNPSSSTEIVCPLPNPNCFSTRRSTSAYAFVLNAFRGCVVSRWSTSPSPSVSTMPRGLKAEPLRQNAMPLR